MAKSLFGVKEGGQMVFLARFKSILIRTGGWAGHFVLSCGLTLQTLVSRIMMLNKLREMSSRGPSGHPDGASWGRRVARAIHGKVFTVQALLLRFTNSGTLSLSLDLTNS